MASLRQLAGCVFFLYLHSLCVGVFPDAELIRQHGDSIRHTQDRTLYGHHVPVLKMMKRMVRGFRRGYVPSITLIFYASQPVQVRWYKPADPTQFSNSVVRKMIPIKDGSSCSISSVKAGDVVATTLTLQQWSVKDKHDYETIITTNDGTMQYQLSTKVSRGLPSGGRLDLIDSPEWMAVPPPHIAFTPGQPLLVHCKVFVPTENNTAQYTNELMMYRALIANDIDVNRAVIKFDSVIAIHKGTQNIAEETPGVSNNLTFFATGSRTSLSNDVHAIYQLMLKTRTATSNLSGIYQCALERKYDKLYVISRVTPVDVPSVFPTTPFVELIHCASTGANERKLILQEGKDTCIRCRGAGYPTPTIRVTGPDDKELTENLGHVTVDSYINVADAGVHEKMYTFHNPNRQNIATGQYKCEADNNEQSAEIHFQVEF